MTLRAPGGSPIFVDAQNFERDLDKGITVLTGNVRVIYSQQYLSCDRAVINERTHLVEAEGNLIISSSQSYIEGERAVLNYIDNTGVIENGFVKSGQVLFEGRIVRRLGPDTWEAEKSYYTACTTCPTAWSFSGTRMHAEIGGYAYIKNPVMSVANVPVFWLPYLIIPLKTERQTGLLIPTIEIGSQDSFVIGPRYFWAISRSQDAMLTLKVYPKRGIKALANYRYMLNSDSEGELDFGILHDSKFAADPYFYNNPVGRNSQRWFLNYSHKYDLPFEITQKTKLNLASDLWYPRDFGLEMPGRGDPALENRMSVTRNTESTHASLDADYYVNMLKENPTESNNDAVHRWPELKYSRIEKPIFSNSWLSGLQFGFNIDYVNFARNGFGYDDISATQQTNPTTGQLTDAKAPDPTRTKSGTLTTGKTFNGGVFDPSIDIVRAGQRLDFQPEISYPLQLGPYLDLLSAIQFRHTQYSFNVSAPSEPYDTAPSRSYLRGSISARTRFYRVFGDPAGISAKPQPRPPATSWIDAESRTEANRVESENAASMKMPERPSVYRHEFQPEVTLASVPFIQQPSSHPFFSQGAQVPIFLAAEPLSNVNLTNDPSSIQFDYNDRISSRNMISLALGNRLVRKRWLGETADYMQIASLKIGESYDIDESRRETGDRLPYADIWTNADVHLDYFDAVTAIRYFPYHGVTDSTSSMRFKNLMGTNYVEFGYTQTYIITHDVRQTQKQPDSFSIAPGFSTRYLDLAGGLNWEPQSLTPITFQLKSWTTDLNIKPPGNCWGIKIHYEQPFGGDRTIQLFFDYNFGGMTG